MLLGVKRNQSIDVELPGSARQFTEGICQYDSRLEKGQHRDTHLVANAVDDVSGTRAFTRFQRVDDLRAREPRGSQRCSSPRYEPTTR